MAFTEHLTRTKSNNGHESVESKKSESKDRDAESGCTTLGQSLLQFMNLATGSVKMALQKPANYKKNINHRRYLQKQLKICTRRKRRGTKAKNGGNSKKGTGEMIPGILPARDWLNRGNLGQMYPGSQSVEARQNLTIPAAETACLSHETLFPAVNVFSTVECSFQDLCNVGVGQNGFVAPNPMIPAQEDALCSTQAVGGLVSREDLVPEVLVEAENFMTGEELTRTLDIKDLFVPERNFEETADFSYAYGDEILLYNNNFQTIPSTTNVLSW